jgi:hypothetical protein
VKNRTTGFSFPPHPRQLFVILYILWDASTFFVCVVETLQPLSVKIALTFLMAMVLAVVVVAGIILMATNPADPNVVIVSRSRSGRVGLADEAGGVDSAGRSEGGVYVEQWALPGDKFCYVCQTNV